MGSWDEQDQGSTAVPDGYDVLVVGGGAAGLSGALTLARARRRVLVVDDGSPRNRPARHMYGFLGHDGLPPAELLARGRAEVTAYGAQVREGTVKALRREGDGFTAALTDGARVVARRVLVATGLRDALPDVPGVAERWGVDVLHCPYCHGWEVRDRAIGIIASGAMAVHQALLWRQWSADVTLVLHTADSPGAEDAERLAARGVRVVDGVVDRLEVENDRVRGIRLADGRVVPVEAVVVGTRMESRTDPLAGTGLDGVDLLMGSHVVGTHLVGGPSGETDVPGIWVAGNASDLRAQVVTAAAAGSTAAAAINADLVEQDTRDAVGRARAAEAGPASAHGHEGPFDRTYWEDRFSGRERLWSGDPNSTLVAEAADLAPGRAADVGSGEGGDAVWLARRGWDVTAVDVADAALRRVTELAAQAGPEVAARVRTVRSDAAGWAPEPRSFDLVTSHYLHPDASARAAVLATMADAVVPGGTLLVVNHDRSDVHAGVGRMDRPELFASAEEMAALLDPDEWEVLVAEARPRTVRDGAGTEVAVRDAVLCARRVRR